MSITTGSTDKPPDPALALRDAQVARRPPLGRRRPEGAEVRRALAARDLAVARHRAAAGLRLGLSDTELLVIFNLAVRGEFTPSVLGRRVQRSSAAISALLQRLDDAGWLVRRAHPADRRSQLIRLSATGVARAEAAYAPLTRVVERATTARPAAERAAILGFLHQIVAITEHHADLLLAGQSAERPDRTLVPALWG